MNSHSVKYLIGLTGNIATGKSVIRRMLEHLGVFGIDADQLAHRLIYKGAPGYRPVINEFGEGILGSDGEIDRSTLGRIVFNDLKALSTLEEIIHPLVRNSTSKLVTLVPFSYIVIEAIKLLESKIAAECSSIWVSTSNPALQLERLMETRAMDGYTAQQRIELQPSQSDKISAADFVIENNSSYWEIWGQVKDAFAYITNNPEIEMPQVRVDFDQIQIYRCTPDDIEVISNLLAKYSADEFNIEPEEILKDLSNKAYLILSEVNQQIGIVRWELNNFISIVDRLYIHPNRHNQEFMGKIIYTLDLYFNRYLAEINVFILPDKGILSSDVLSQSEYREIHRDEITAAAWRGAISRKTSSWKSIWMKEISSAVNSVVSADFQE